MCLLAASEEITGAGLAASRRQMHLATGERVRHSRAREARAGEKSGFPVRQILNFLT